MRFKTSAGSTRLCYVITGIPSLQENKSKLIKLRKKIMLNRNCKPKAIEKLMQYVQRVGGEVMKSCQQSASVSVDNCNM